MSPLTIFTTGHSSNGMGVFIDNPSAKFVSQNVTVLYGTTSDGAVDVNKDADLAAFTSQDIKATGVIPNRGSAVLAAEFPPGTDSRDKAHRTMSVDIGVVVQGEVECVLDGGERRLIRTGEMLLQRGTKHYWVNPSHEVTARMLCFVLPSKAIEGLDG